MAEEKAKTQWDHTSLIWATLANSMRDPKKHRQPFSPADVHPFRDRSDYERPQEVGIDILKLLLTSHGTRARN